MWLFVFRGMILINMGAVGCFRLSVLLGGLLSLCAILYVSLSPETSRREYVSVFMVGTRGLDVPMESPDRLIEYATLKLLPEIQGGGGGKWEGGVVFKNKPGSRFVQVITHADMADSARVEKLHRNLLEALLARHESHLRKIKENLERHRSAQQMRLQSGGLTGEKLGNANAAIVSVTDALENFEPSEIVQVSSIVSAGKLENKPVRMVLSILTALLFVWLLVSFWVFSSRRGNIA